MSYQEQTTANQTVAPPRDEKLATQSVFDTSAADPSLRNFVDQLKAAGVTAVLCGPDLVTLLALTNEAIRSDQPVQTLRDYVLRGAFTADELRRSGSIKTLDGRVLEVTGGGGEIRIAGAKVIRADIECTNGVIHVIESPLA